MEKIIIRLYNNNVSSYSRFNLLWMKKLKKCFCLQKLFLLILALTVLTTSCDKVYLNAENHIQNNDSQSDTTIDPIIPNIDSNIVIGVIFSADEPWTTGDVPLPGLVWALRNEEHSCLILEENNHFLRVGYDSILDNYHDEGDTIVINGDIEDRIDLAGNSFEVIIINR